MPQGKNILIISSNPGRNQALVDLFMKLRQNGYNLWLLSSANFWLQQFKKQNWPAGKLYLGPRLNHGFASILFMLLWPLLCLIWLISLVYYKYRKKISLIMCLSRNEKILITPLARLFKLTVIWLELPDQDFNHQDKLPLALYRFFSSSARLISFTSYTTDQLLKLKIKASRIKAVSPGIRLHQFEYQDNIYNSLARSGQPKLQRKYFTLGIVADLDRPQRIESLFQATKICLTVIPNLQLIIVGEGQARRGLNWLAKKMELDTLTWFVGQQNYLKKWLDSFDIFIAASQRPDLDDLATILRAMASGLPVIAPADLGFADLIKHEQNGILTNNGDSETMAQQIIKLYKNRHWRLHLAKQAKQAINKNFNLDTMVNNIIRIIE